MVLTSSFHNTKAVMNFHRKCCCVTILKTTKTQNKTKTKQRQLLEPSFYLLMQIHAKTKTSPNIIQVQMASTLVPLYSLKTALIEFKGGEMNSWCTYSTPYTWNLKQKSVCYIPPTIGLSSNPASPQQHATKKELHHHIEHGVAAHQKT